jgi:mono/diheme cytochrome c family protein
MNRILTFHGPLACLMAILSLPLLSVSHADDVLFNRDVKPILSQNCFQCHGPDDAHRAAVCVWINETPQ